MSVRIFTALMVIAVTSAGCGDSEDTPGTLSQDGSDVVTVDTTLPETVVFDTNVADTSVPDTTQPPGDTTEAPDTTPGEDTTPPDDTTPPADTTTGECNTFGCPCSSNSECIDELCIEGVDGQVCTKPCIAECPAGYDCLNASGFGPDPISICVPSHVRLCRPCRTDADCDSPLDALPAFCLPAADPAEGSFCGSSCASSDCPEGYSCEDVDLPAGGSATQCVPDAGICSCQPSWAAFGFATDCQIENDFGTCGGTRSCGDAGLSACEGEAATAEVCDGLDNDCNGVEDDIDPTPCPVTNSFGSCDGTAACGPDGPICQGSEASPETCDGVDNDCDDQIDEDTCDDGLPCTVDSCASPGNCSSELQPGFCAIDGQCVPSGSVNLLNPCETCNTALSTSEWSQTANTCVINGACLPNGATNPANGCEICDAAADATGWSDTPNVCSIGGQCYQANQANPANPCEICQPINSTNSWTQALASCSIQGECYAANVERPGQPCFFCDPSSNPTGWTPKSSSASCDDGDPCSSDDHCDGAGTCVGDTSCDDDIPCTDDVCTATGCDNTGVESGTCRIKNKDGEDVCWEASDVNPAQPCQHCVSGTAWSPRPSTVSCDDGNACTTSDKCSNGACAGGPPLTCSDGNVCTTDSCDPATGCKFTNNTIGCDDGNSCTNGDVCGSGSCTGNYIVDANEGSGGNNTPATAKNLGNLDDGMNYPATTSGTLYGPGDVDWYKYWVDDVGGGNTEPRVDLKSIPPAQNFDLCFYPFCTADAQKHLNCPDGTVAAPQVSIEGKTRKGCCSRKTGAQNERVYLEIRLIGADDFECDGSDDSYRAYVKVENVSTGVWQCSDGYSLEYGDD